MATSTLTKKTDIRSSVAAKRERNTTTRKRRNTNQDQDRRRPGAKKRRPGPAEHFFEEGDSMNYPDVIFLGAPNTKGYPAKVAALPTDEYFMNPDRDPDNDGKVKIPIIVLAEPEQGGGYQFT